MVLNKVFFQLGQGGVVVQVLHECHRIVLLPVLLHCHQVLVHNLPRVSVLLRSRDNRLRFLIRLVSGSLVSGERVPGLRLEVSFLLLDLLLDHLQVVEVSDTHVFYFFFVPNSQSLCLWFLVAVVNAFPLHSHALLEVLIALHLVHRLDLQDALFLGCLEGSKVAPLLPPLGVDQELLFIWEPIVGFVGESADLGPVLLHHERPDHFSLVVRAQLPAVLPAYEIRILLLH